MQLLFTKVRDAELSTELILIKDEIENKKQIVTKVNDNCC